MKEEKQIVRASMLEDIEPAEKLDAGRAKTFVSSVMQESESAKISLKSFLFGRYRSIAYGVSAVLAAAVVAAIFIFQSGSEQFGTPAELLEQPYTHASMADVDSFPEESQDSLFVINEEKQ